MITCPNELKSREHVPTGVFKAPPAGRKLIKYNV